MDDTDLREQARKRLKAKRHFWEYLGVWIVVAVVLSVIWLLSSHNGYFWPVWPIAAMGIAALFIGLDAYGPGSRVITDADIDREVGKMTGRKTDQV
jgi:ABC-type xylose transport system permease subunit